MASSATSSCGIGGNFGRLSLAAPPKTPLLVAPPKTGVLAPEARPNGERDVESLRPNGEAETCAAEELPNGVVADAIVFPKGEPAGRAPLPKGEAAAEVVATALKGETAVADAPPMADCTAPPKGDSAAVGAAPPKGDAAAVAELANGEAIVVAPAVVGDVACPGAAIEAPNLASVALVGCGPMKASKRALLCSTLRWLVSRCSVSL